MKRDKKPNRIIKTVFLVILLIPLLLFIGIKYFLRDVKSATAPAITSLSPTSGTILGGGSLTINGTDLGDAFNRFQVISAGGSHTCGVYVDGGNKVYCWGGNSNGQLGNGSTTNSITPVSVSQGARPPGVTFSSISAGTNHTCAVGSDGEGYCWGYNYYGQLGNGSTTQSTTPVLVSQGARPSGVTFSSISAGTNHTCAIGSDGEGYCWGYNYHGRLGDGSTTQRTTPVLVSQGARPSGVTFSSISAGGNHTCAIGSDGEGYCWGDNSSGQLGNGSTTQSTTPVLVSQGARPAGVTFSSISAGTNHTCAVGSDGEGYCWGRGTYGQLGNGSTTQSTTPVLVSQGARPSGVTFSSISAGNQHTCAVGSNGEGYCWGYNSSGQLGNGSTTSSNVPVLVSQGARPSGVTFSSISAGGNHTCAIGSDGEGYCWGNNSTGQLGNVDNNGGTTLNTTPVLVGAYEYQISIGSNTVTQYIPAGSTSITVSPIPAHVAGTVSVSLKRLYDNQTSNSVSYTYTNLPAPDITSISPSAITPLGGTTINLTGTNFLDYGPMNTLGSISTGNNHTCAIDSNGEGYCWGLNGYGQLGNGSTTQSTTPVLVSQGARPSGVTFSSISAGTNHTCAVGSDGEGYCWGRGTYGQLGNGSTTQSTTPVLVSQGARPSGVTFSSISAGGNHTCAIGSDGEGYCWGYNSSGQLGNGSTTQSTTPVLVSQGARPAGVTFSSISAGTNHTCAVGSDGEGYCWGRGTYGQLGNGSTTQRTTPVLVSQGARPSGVTFSSISAGNQHTCAVGSNGEGYCWGYNYYGQLGNGSTTQRTTPVLVSQGARPSGVTFSSISAGGNHTCAIGSDGEGYCWGYNYYGQLGNGGTAQSTTPVLVSQGAVPSGVTFSSISAGTNHSCGRLSNNRTLCWGGNQYGQLGTDDQLNRPTPAYVLIIKSPTIEFGSTSATSTTYTSTTAMSAVSPTLSAGTIPVKLTNPDGQYDIYNIFAGTIPSAPLNLVATYGDGQVTLGWNKPADEGGGVTDYIIQYSNDGGSTWSTFNDGTSSNRYTTVTGLTNGNLYTFRVAAVNPAGTGAYSNTVQSTPQALVITSISPTSGTYLGGGSMTIEATGLGDYQKFTQVSIGQYHTCGLALDGNVYCWGYNNNGQLGNGNTGTNSNVPVLVSQGDRLAGVTFVSISAGSSHTCGVGSDGNGYCWGYNVQGQLGNGTSGYGVDSNSPVLVSQGDRSSGVTFVSISAGASHTCGIGSDGNGYCWGYNNRGQLGNGNTGTDSNVPKLVSQGDRSSGVTFVSISAGDSHTCGVGSDGEGYCWGYNSFGQLGNGNTGTDSNVPKLVSQGDRSSGVTFVSISAGDSHTCGVGSDGEGYCWGYNSNGQLGNGNTGTDSNVPKLVSQGDRSSGVTFVSISAGNSYTCGVGSDGNGYCWGYNELGQLGNGNTGIDSNVPKLVTKPSGVTFASVSAGTRHTCGIVSNGKGYCWGINNRGQLGDGTKFQRTTPVLVKFFTNYEYQIAIGNNTITQPVSPDSTSITVTPIPAHAIGVVSVSLTRVYDNKTSNSKNYTYTNLPAPDITNINPSTISPLGGTTVNLTGTNFSDLGPNNLLSVISVGSYHSCGLDSSGNGYCWGYNTNGELGNGSTTGSSLPVLVSQGARSADVTFSSISAGSGYTCGIGSDGEGYCWGDNETGQLGNGNTGIDSNVPVLVSQGARSAGVTFNSISAGGWPDDSETNLSHTCAVGSNGQGYCWGNNEFGQLGNGNTGTNSNVPVLVSQGARSVGVTFTSISVGNNHTCAVGSDGEGYCWGLNDYGQLGNGNTGTDSNIPVLVGLGDRDTGVTFSSISAGGVHTCGLGSDGNGYCWGNNGSGQLGNDNPGTNSNVPVLVSQGARSVGVTFASISVGYNHTCGLGSDGNGYCWGRGTYGQLGNGSTTQSTTPVLVSQGVHSTSVSFNSISAGHNHTCGVSSNTKSFCWGYNGFGQLGNNETVGRVTMSYVLKKENPKIEFGTTLAASTTYTSTTSMSAVSPILSTYGTTPVKLTNPDGQYDTYDITVLSPPNTPGNLTATVGNTEISLSWSVPSSDGGSAITDYIIQYRRYDEENWTTFDDGMSTNTTATVTGLTNDKLYYFKVAAVNSIGVSSYTDPVTSTPTNPAPSFTEITNTTTYPTTNPVAPLGYVTWNAVASDGVSANTGTGGTVKLLICATQGITSAGACSGTELCHSNLVASNPSCSYQVPDPTKNGPHNAYAYVVDNQNKEATGVDTVQGDNSSYIVGSVAPSVTSVLINGGATDIVLAEKGALDYTAVTITTQVTSPNTCSSISSVKAYLYRSGKGYTGCNKTADANNNYCYPEVTCTLNSGSCVNPNDSSANYTCVAHVKYHADPTDTGTQYDSENWLATTKVTGDGGLSGSAEAISGAEMRSLVAFDITDTLHYGTLRIGESNNPNTDNPMQVITTTATGNVGLNQQHKGENVGMCTDFPTCEANAPISLSYQKYALSSSTTYADATALTGASVSVSLNVPKVTSVPTSRSTWWGVFIPSLNPTKTGTYSGQNTITAEKSPAANW